MPSFTLHEPADQLTDRTINVHRAIVSLMEELEAIDWYNQRAEACTDAQLQAVIEHNRDEEIEHACMALEWIRRNVAKFDEALKLYLFSSGDITAIEESEKERETQEPAEQSAKPEQGGRRVTVGEMKGK